MARVGLSIELSLSEDCDTLYLTDDTGNYPTVSDGYGMPAGILINDVTRLVINFKYLTVGTYITYTFTVSSGTISAATLSVQGGTATNILSHLVSTVFPLTNFQLTRDYGVTIPDFDDGIYQADYTVSGITIHGDFEDFSYTTSGYMARLCDLCCCVSQKFADIDSECECANDSIMEAVTADAFLKTAINAMNLGDTDKANTAFLKAKNICDCESNCQGCN